MRYAWLITEDRIAEEGDAEGTYLNAKGLAGPGTATESEILSAAAKGCLFKMYDGDGEHYYTGRLWLADDSHLGVESREITLNPGDKPLHCVTSLPEEAFGPLNDFGTPNAGCTEIRFRTRQGRMAAL